MSLFKHDTKSQCILPLNTIDMKMLNIIYNLQAEVSKYYERADYDN